jgi:hypothetical protein
MHRSQRHRHRNKRQLASRCLDAMPAILSRLAPSLDDAAVVPLAKPGRRGFGKARVATSSNGTFAAQSCAASRIVDLSSVRHHAKHAYAERRRLENNWALGGASTKWSTRLVHEKLVEWKRVRQKAGMQSWNVCCVAAGNHVNGFPSGGPVDPPSGLWQLRTIELAS